MEKQTITFIPSSRIIEKFIVNHSNVKIDNFSSKMFAFKLEYNHTLNDDQLILVKMSGLNVPIVIETNKEMLESLFLSIYEFEPNADLIVVSADTTGRGIIQDRFFIRSNIEIKEKILQLNNDSGLHTWSEYGWEKSEVKFTKTFASIYLDDKILCEIRKKISTFVSHKSDYEKNGIPYKLSFLFEGNPGTGKTSVVKAIANELKSNVFIIPAEKISSFGSVVHHLKQTTKNYKSIPVIVFEDIHKLLPEIYNQIYGFLDGIYDITNCVIIMTTNVPHKKLDPTLVRAGRVNSIIHFDYLTEELMVKMFNIILPNHSHLTNKFINKIKHMKITPAILESYLMQYGFDDEKSSVIENIQELINTANHESESYANFDGSNSGSLYS
jgi:hypothetical protein